MSKTVEVIRGVCVDQHASLIRKGEPGEEVIRMAQIEVVGGSRLFAVCDKQAVLSVGDSCEILISKVE